MAGGRKARPDRGSFFRRLIALALVGLTGSSLLPAGVARAQDARAESESEPREQARLRLAEGNHLFRAGDYDGAVGAYRAAYALVPSDKLHFNIGLAEKMRGNAVEAAREMDRFLASDAGQATELRADAIRYQDELVPLVGTVRVQLVAGDHVLVDGAPIEGVATDRPIRLSPGNHQLIVRREGHADWGQGLELTAGANLNVVPAFARVVAIDRTLPPGAASSSSAPLIDTAPATPTLGANDGESPSPIYHRWWFWTVIAGVVGAGVVALTLRGGDGGGCQVSHGCVPLMRKALETP